MQRGTEKQLHAKVQGTLDTVTWSLSGNEAAGTRIGADGTLTVAADETASTLTVRATSAVNTAYYAECEVSLIDAPVTIESVKISADKTEVIRGNSVYFTAEVVGTDVHDLLWTLSGNSSASTEIYSPDGSLSASLNVSDGETAELLTVRATSARDSSKYDELTVKVLPKHIISAAIDIRHEPVTLTEEMTGREATELLRSSITSPKGTSSPGAPGGWYVYTDSDYTTLVENRGENYLPLHNSDEPLRADGEYYFYFNIENTGEYEWDTESFPTITVNGAAPDAAMWHSSYKSDVDVYVRAKLSTATEPVYPVWVGGVQVTGANKDDVLEDGGSVTYDPLGKTLTLTDADVTAADISGPPAGTHTAGIIIGEDMTLKLEGDSTITGIPASSYSYGICCTYYPDYHLTVTGEGSLTVTAGEGVSIGSIGVSVKSLTMDGGTLIAGGGKSENASSYGVYARNLTVNGGSLIAAGGEAKSGSYGVGNDQSGEHVYTINGGTVEARGNSAAFGHDPDLSGYAPAPAVRVNTAASSAGATAWDGMAALGGSSSAYKYVKIAPSVFYTVTFDGNGHGEFPPLKVAAGMNLHDAIELGELWDTYFPNELIDGKYMLDDWYLDAECTELCRFDVTVINADLTLYALWNEYTVLHSAEATFRTPRIGDTIDPSAIFTAPGGTDYYARVASIDDAPYGTAVSGVYEDKTYYAVVEFQCKQSDCLFDADTVVNVNGTAVDAPPWLPSGDFYVWYPINPLDPTLPEDAIESAALTVAEPVIGAPIPVRRNAGDFLSVDVGVEDGAGYVVFASAWGVMKDGRMEPAQAGDVFEAGREYELITILMPKDGYFFDDAATATVNGMEPDEVTIVTEIPGIRCLGVRHIFTASEPVEIRELRFTIEEAVTGAVPSTVMQVQTEPAGGLTVDSVAVVWYEGDSHFFSEAVPMTTPTFEYGKHYFIVSPDLSSVIAPGYILPINPYILTNGIIEVYSNLGGYIYYKGPMPPIPITEVALEGGTAPLVGKAPDTTSWTLPADAHYSIVGTPHWYNLTDRHQIAAGEKFEQGKMYQFDAQFKADEGYQFAPREDMTAVFKDIPADLINEIIIRISGDNRSVTLRFDFLPTYSVTISDKHLGTAREGYDPADFSQSIYFVNHSSVPLDPAKIRVYADNEDIIPYFNSGAGMLGINGGFDNAELFRAAPREGLDAGYYETVLTLEYDVDGDGTYEVTLGSCTVSFTVTDDVGLLSEDGEPFTVGKILRSEGMSRTAGGTGEPNTYGYDPDNISMTLRVLGASTPGDALTALNGATFERAVRNAGGSIGFERLTLTESDSSPEDERILSYAKQNGEIVPVMHIRAYDDGGVHIELTSLAPGAVRLTLEGREYLLATPGDVNLDGEMDANDWANVMRWALEAPSSRDTKPSDAGYTVTLNENEDYNLWILMADIDGKAISNSADEAQWRDIVDSNDWRTIMYLTLEAWKK